MSLSLVSNATARRDRRVLLLATVALGALVAGCGDDAPNTSLDAGIDADASADAAQGADSASPDTAAADAAGDGTSGTDGAAPATDGAGGSDAMVAAPITGHLLVADLTAEAIYAYALPGLQLTGQLEKIKLDNHLGTLVLADGRVLLSDAKAGEILAVKLDAAGKPAIVNRVKAQLGTQGVWGATDAAFKYLVVASGKDGLTQTANIVDLTTFTLTAFDVTMKVDEELHPFLGGPAPGWLMVGVGGELQAFPLDQILMGAKPAPAATLAIGTGSHGPVISHDLKRVYVTTMAGLDAVTFGAGTLTAATRLPWNVGARMGGRNGRPRLSWDGNYVYGAVTAPEPAGAEKWAERQADVHVADLINETSSRFPLATGVVGRFQLSRRHALFSVVAGDGDAAYLFDVERGSPTFHQIVGKVPLTKLTNGPVAGMPTAGKEARASAITPDSRWAFVSHGGDGAVSVIDVTARAVAGKIMTPTPLKGGGYLVTVQPGVAPTDTCTR